MATFYCDCHDQHVAPSHLCNRHCSNFFRSDAYEVLSIQASQHKKMGLRGNNCGRLELGIVLLIDPVLIIEGDKRSLQS